MKKILIFCLSLMLFLSGCSHTKINDKQQKVYDSFKESLLNNGELISSNIPFDYRIEIAEKEDQYLYTVIVDNPLVAMSNIQMMILNPDDLSKDIIFNTVGIFDETPVYMIPNQKNEQKGYLSELKLTGAAVKKDFKIYAILVWKDNNQLIQYQSFFSFNIVNGKNVKE